MFQRIRSLVVLIAAVCLSATLAAQTNVNVTVDANVNRHAISPLIYGVHFADTPTLLDLNATVNRYGGNSAGRYNWLQNIDNRGGDFFFESIPYASSTAGELGDTFISATKAGGAEPYETMPMVGWVAKTDAFRNTLSSFSVLKYAPTIFTGSDGDAGNGCTGGGIFYPCAIGSKWTFNDPNDASIPADSVFQQAWAQHIKDTFGAASAGGLRYWGLDNEPTIWHDVYWDVHPVPATTDEMSGKMIDYGGVIKAVDSTAQVMGPEEWGFDGYIYSGQDLQAISDGTCWYPGSGAPECPDRAAHGHMDYVPYLLSQMQQHEINTGNRVLDFLTLHFYPQGGELSDDDSTAMQDLRNRSTRGLWDPTYVNESYIGGYPPPYDKIQLIPRMKSWVAANYPGLKTGMTEYNWGDDGYFIGGGGHMNGATAQADVMGICGREDLDMAVRWVAPNPGPVYNAFKMYRNYDGAKSTFGDTSISATSDTDTSDFAVFGGQRTADGSVTIMLDAKNRTTSYTATVNLANISASGPAQVWQLPSPGTTISRLLPDIPVVGNTVSITVPAQSITLLVIPTGCVPPGAPTAGGPPQICEGQTLNLTATTIPGATYAWTGPNGFTSNVQNPFISNVTTAATGTYSVTATVGCTSAPGTTDVLVNPLPNATITAPSSVTPNSTGITASVPDAGLGATYVWTALNGSVDSGGGSRSITFTAGPSGTVTLGVIVTTIDGCQTRSSKLIPIGTLKFFTILPCRLIDTRNTPPSTYGAPALLGGGAQRDFPIGGQCGVPTDVMAISINMTVAQPTASGDLRAFPTGTPAPNASAINFRTLRTRANNAILPIDGTPPASLTIQNDAPGSTNFLLDINGYFELMP